MNVLAIIPARGGSKGIPKKNIVPIAGKPLLAWTIEAAKQCRFIDKVVVSSDSDEILSVAQKYGAESLKRPAELSTDTSLAEPVVTHVLKACADTGYVPDLVVYLQPTSPLRTAKHLDEALTLLNEKDADGLVSVFRADNKILKAFVSVSGGYIAAVSDPKLSFGNRQELPKVYMQNGAIYIFKAKDFLKEPNFSPKRTVPFVMSEEDSIDVDSPQDLQAIEAILNAS